VVYHSTPNGLTVTNYGHKPQESFR
jgi:hypothetical protein